MYVKGQKNWKSNNLKVFGRKITKEQKHDSKNQLRLTMPEWGEHYFTVIIITSFRVRARVMVFNPRFNNISAIYWQSVLLVKETGVTGENQTWHKSLTNFITYSCLEHRRNVKNCTLIFLHKSYILLIYSLGIQVCH